MKRGAVKRNESTMISLWFPKGMARAIDQAVNMGDLDRSKFIRLAVKEKLAMHGIRVENPETVEASR